MMPYLFAELLVVLAKKSWDQKPTTLLFVSVVVVTLFRMGLTEMVPPIKDPDPTEA
jgi:hypothetical protein